jgi:hypothetical protein
MEGRAPCDGPRTIPLRSSTDWIVPDHASVDDSPNLAAFVADVAPGASVYSMVTLHRLLKKEEEFNAITRMWQG